MIDRSAAPDILQRKETQAAALDLTREFLRELHPGARERRPVTLDSALERDLGLDSLSRAELAVRIERAFNAKRPEPALGGVLTLRDLLAALKAAAGSPIAEPPARVPAYWPEEPTRVVPDRSEEHTSELQSPKDLVCRLL